ncbi:alpha-glucosidase [Catenibacillus scindens]|uniref:Alpha-glucosidase n=1 Tax=Catenibacillus scindens TaxID=673271 RepID=A0A7W8M6F7_9FIRM|nr:TIM-barrel domain-containing protein [Catenibacillus scindens]MBB5266050.1 alpha-glucosidase [Catenibacillus scindens]
MVEKYVYGTPFETDAVVVPTDCKNGHPPIGKTDIENGYTWTYTMSDNDIVYGLGEANRGINKRGYIYISNCTDESNHTEDICSLYTAHNFIIISGEQHWGLFFDYPSVISFDIGYSRQDLLTVHCDSSDLNVYIINGKNAYDVVLQFRKIIGQSYIPPKFAFGFGQSRNGYATEDELRQVLKGYRKNHIPLDMIFMDIDYMENFKDFTVNSESFPDFEAFVNEMREQKIHLIPIIDAGVKIEKGYDVYEEGVAGDYFCKREDNSIFAATVWPGRTHFPDFLNRNAREWFGKQYKKLLDIGIDGFWNDMNEPAIFHSDEGLGEVKQFLREYLDDTTDQFTTYHLFAHIGTLRNNPKDYTRFFHNVDGQRIRHDKVHNLYGYNMTRAASEAFERIVPSQRILMFSRSSYIGMHRYGGIWTGDNKSWWSHLLLNIKMMPSLNMCGFLYIGADLGGFGANTTRDLLLRWLAFGVFTPLMRNHTTRGTRAQECYAFEHPEDFKDIISVRYRLLPYIYSEYMKAALNNDLYFKPLGFLYPDDDIARSTEDQLIIGNEIMITPVYTQNVPGRIVYLPEDMLLVKFSGKSTIFTQQFFAGHHYIYIGLNEVVLFIRKGHCIPVAMPAETVGNVDSSTLTLFGYNGASYDLYEDDGISKNYEYSQKYLRRLSKTEQY